MLAVFLLCGLGLVVGFMALEHRRRQKAKSYDLAHPVAINPASIPLPNAPPAIAAASPSRPHTMYASIALELAHERIPPTPPPQAQDPPPVVPNHSDAPPLSSSGPRRAENVASEPTLVLAPVPPKQRQKVQEPPTPSVDAVAKRFDYPQRPTDGDESSDDEALITSEPAYTVETRTLSRDAAPAQEADEERASDDQQHDTQADEQEEEEEQQEEQGQEQHYGQDGDEQLSQSGGRPPWLHGVSKGKDEDRALLQDPATGEFPDGWFFVAELGTDSSNYPGHVLNINFRGKATRHLVKADDTTGFLLVNKKS